MMQNKSANLQRLLLVALLVGFITMVGDWFTHTFFTSPLEVPAYYGAKFVLATVAAIPALLIPSLLIGTVFGALLFDALAGVYYFFAYYLHNNALSCCYLNAPQVFFMPQYVFFTAYGYTVDTNFLAFALLIHPLAFVIGFLLVAPFAHLKH